MLMQKTPSRSVERVPFDLFARSLINLVGNYPLADYRQDETIDWVMAKRKQIQPLSGVERAFGHAMRKARVRHGLSQMDLYKVSGLDRTFISDLERGVQGPSLATLFRVAKGIGEAPEVLIQETLHSPYFRWPTKEL